MTASMQYTNFKIASRRQGIAIIKERNVPEPFTLNYVNPMITSSYLVVKNRKNRKSSPEGDLRFLVANMSFCS